MTRSYKLYWTGATTGDAKTNLKIVRGGRITSVLFSLVGLGGAGSGQQQIELSKQSANSIATNDTPATVIAQVNIAYQNGVYNGCCPLMVGMSHQVDSGDQLYIHQIDTGTAPATNTHCVTVVVEEN